MVEIPAHRRDILAPLFDGWEETLIWSVLQGCMGKAWTDNGDNPRCALLWIGDFLILGGDPHCPGARELAGCIPEGFYVEEAIFIPQNRLWQELVERAHQGRGVWESRYAIRKEPWVFQRAKLEAYRDSLPPGFSLRAIDRELHRTILQTPWAWDFCGRFPQWEDFAAHGHGFVALHGEELAAGASTYSWYRGGIEIEIDTKEEYRRKGLALCCASALILHCLDLGLYPSWDAANLTSVALAEKLGYHFDHEYPCYMLKWRELS
ncbi:MAG: GNAT family N-acetyltransferase [Acutalibacter sp.]|jgi:RimJ/RimL family protein N-acetyltransferase